MKKTLFLISISLIYSCIVSAETISEKPKSVLYLDNAKSQKSTDHKAQHFDFSKSIQGKIGNETRQNESGFIQMNENQSNTANMSSFERSQYFLNNHDNHALRAEENMQNYRSLERAKNRGIISNKDYEKGVRRAGQVNPLDNDQKQGLNFNFTFGE